MAEPFELTPFSELNEADKTNALLIAYYQSVLYELQCERAIERYSAFLEQNDYVPDNDLETLIRQRTNQMNKLAMNMAKDKFTTLFTEAAERLKQTVDIPKLLTVLDVLNDENVIDIEKLIEVLESLILSLFEGEDLWTFLSVLGVPSSDFSKIKTSYSDFRTDVLFRRINKNFFNA